MPDKQKKVDSLRIFLIFIGIFRLIPYGVFNSFFVINDINRHESSLY